ncbi:glycoside hydrolase family 2 [candidate division KSB1 bacterium]|nr:glycoside hydrolase family 2 [candidate division KSB1 bacterium]
MTQDKLDFFAQIALERVQQRNRSLVEPEPAPLPDEIWQSETIESPRPSHPLEKLDTAEKLEQELARQREAYAPFMRRLAPAPATMRLARALSRFNWRIEDETDRGDFNRVLQGAGKWDAVEIPHYGPPLGRASTIYRTTFELDPLFFDPGSIFLRFEGVDYRAAIFVNAHLVGAHEGFFAPFEFDITPVVRSGSNTLVVRVENDFIFMGSRDEHDPERYEGDKLYAATGPGYDDTELGWHHCPPGMGIYQEVRIEARPHAHISDCFVRPMQDLTSAEAWITVQNADKKPQPIAFKLSLYGLNFKHTAFEKQRFEPRGLHIPGLGDVAKRSESLLRLDIGPGENLFRLPFAVEQARLWEPDTPWLYQLHVELLDGADQTIDCLVCDFGMRSFRLESDKKPRGRFFLNDRPIKLRGANTMGHEQQCVMKADWDQLRDDVLLAKIARLNFLRLTQRPVQRQVYEMCDQLGMLTQTDLPLFGVLRRPQMIEAVRQTAEMIRLVRGHPCNAVISYINEPFPNGMDEPHRHLLRSELHDFFTIAEIVVRQTNPDQVIKPVDGDYDPPAPGLPDNHCYCGWYNGHGIDLGKLHKGYWQKVKAGWNFACGEFGSEGLDPVDLMRRRYPSEWLPQSEADEKSWSPDRVVLAQTGRFHYLWFETPDSLQGWVDASQAHQVWITRLMTEAFRREHRMHSFAVHLLIDAFPSGWMKTLVDCERRPKPAYFAYRDALAPLMVCWRSDRSAWFGGASIELEAWICNDTPERCSDLHLIYTLEQHGRVIQSGENRVSIAALDSRCPARVRFTAPESAERSDLLARLQLHDDAGTALSESLLPLAVFPPTPQPNDRPVWCLGKPGAPAERLLRSLGIDYRTDGENQIAPNAVVVLDSKTLENPQRRAIEQAVKTGATAVFFELDCGDHIIAGDRIRVEPCGMGERHFVSRQTRHSLTAGFRADDFKFWYAAALDRVTPLLDSVLEAPGWVPILTSGNGSWQAEWRPMPAAAEKRDGAGTWRICQVRLADHVIDNPPAQWFARRVLELIDPTKQF